MYSWLAIPQILTIKIHIKSNRFQAEHAKKEKETSQSTNLKTMRAKEQLSEILVME